jgi:hypothetical protein
VDQDVVKVWSIAQNTGMVNQEGQLIDSKGRFHALMRGNSSGQQVYEHYLRSTDGKTIAFQ